MKILLAALLIACVVVFCTSFYIKEETTAQTQYTVQTGDTLYSIATDFGIENWRKWSYEVCKNNKLKQGGMIHPGQIITIEVTQ